jgi:spore germination protein YaaH
MCRCSGEIAGLIPGGLKKGFRMRGIFLRLLVVAAALVSAHAETHPVALFYMTDDTDSVRSFLAHSAKIGILVPTWYSVDADGLVSGGPNPLVLEEAQKQHLPVMPIVASIGKDAFHALLANPTAKKAMIAALIRESKNNGYTGFQFDFEDIAWTDRDALSEMVKETADAMHAEGLKLSMATVPNAPGYPGKSGFATWIYEDWRGAYDLKSLAQSVDLICLMTYDQNTRWTTPGPVAGWDWTIENLDYALKVVPKEKLSLGIPVYGYHWYAGIPAMREDPATKKREPHPNISADYIGTPEALLLAREYKGVPQWDAIDHTAWFYINRDQMREWVFYTDKRTFEDRYKLVEERGIEGFCSWVLGSEDPEIWELLPDRK